MDPTFVHFRVTMCDLVFIEFVYVRKRFHFHARKSIRVYILQTAHQMIYKALTNKKLSLATKNEMQFHK